ncbi:DUF6572 domain-containing protein [Streptococcus suis]|uniref:DUF6572 domain-containing protein n=1 Tax=Streptococcus suis TaxID=1307 RepID=UPI00195FD631|nr:DUF6572 domain-containing protein [Streptococcus suis]MBM7283221.1 hypothetical protein [Streptococcus suis]MCO8183825.1 hypothetical protein [Streptococcus suis]MCO8215131.1 hypothetical protein [Streptococcus suis]MCO8237370.1 hypothetical protein [Streptococcus suis]HEM3495263.1 hypothetical protein [Streptococcus suis]
MPLTDITWEEFDTFDKLESPINSDFRTHNGKYYTFGEFGIASVRRVFEIEESDFNEFLMGNRTAMEVNWKAQNGRWPPTAEEKKVLEKRSIEESPTTLIDTPKFRKLFTQTELEHWIPIAEQQWIEWKGKLPENYVSPLVKKDIVLEVTTIDSLGIVDGYLELLLADGNEWLPDTEQDHLLKLQEKLNNYIHFIESKQYVDSYGDDFTEKVINLTFQYTPSDNGLAFLVQVQKVLQPTDIRLKVVVPE